MDRRIGFTGKITRAAARHPWRTLGLWLALLVAAFGASTTMDLASSTDTAGTEATKAMNLIDERLRGEIPPEEFLIVESSTATVDEAAFTGLVDSLVSDLRALEEVASVTSYRDGDEGLVSGDGDHSAGGLFDIDELMFAHVLLGERRKTRHRNTHPDRPRRDVDVVGVFRAGRVRLGTAKRTEPLELILALVTQ